MAMFERHAPNVSFKGRTAFGLAAAVVGVAAIVVVLGSSGTLPPSLVPAGPNMISSQPTHPPVESLTAVGTIGPQHTEFATSVRERVIYGTLHDMVVGAVAVVDGEVQAVEFGERRTLGPDDPGISYTFATLKITDVLAGSLDAPEIVLIEDGVLNARSEVGDNGVYFLWERLDRPGFYRLVSSQGRFLIDGSGNLEGSNPDDPLVRELESLGPDELRAQVRAVGSRPL